jgi:hypothetical protein
LAGEALGDRTGKNGRHALVGMLRQYVFRQLVSYARVNDAERLPHRTAMRWIDGKPAHGCEASASRRGRFETAMPDGANQPVDRSPIWPVNRTTVFMCDASTRRRARLKATLMFQPSKVSHILLSALGSQSGRPFDLTGQPDLLVALAACERRQGFSRPCGERFTDLVVATLDQRAGARARQRSHKTSGSEDNGTASSTRIANNPRPYFGDSRYETDL